jgi:Ca2+/Na+ antiporter
MGVSSVFGSLTLTCCVGLGLSGLIGALVRHTLNTSCHTSLAARHEILFLDFTPFRYLQSNIEHPGYVEVPLNGLVKLSFAFVAVSM